MSKPRFVHVHVMLSILYPTHSYTVPGRFIDYPLQSPHLEWPGRRTDERLRPRKRLVRSARIRRIIRRPPSPDASFPRRSFPCCIFLFRSPRLGGKIGDPWAGKTHSCAGRVRTISNWFPPISFGRLAKRRGTCHETSLAQSRERKWKLRLVLFIVTEWALTACRRGRRSDSPGRTPTRTIARPHV